MRRLFFAMIGAVAIMAIALLAASGPANGPLPVARAAGSAGYTTFDQTQGGCLDSPNGINCNNYSAKDKLYMSGGPTGGNALPNGTYYFAVLAPGYQNGGFIDGADGNLSDTTPSNGGPGGGDTAAKRTSRSLTV